MYHHQTQLKKQQQRNEVHPSSHTTVIPSRKIELIRQQYQLLFQKLGLDGEQQNKSKETTIASTSQQRHQ